MKVVSGGGIQITGIEGRAGFGRMAFGRNPLRVLKPCSCHPSQALWGCPSLGHANAQTGCGVCKDIFIPMFCSLIVASLHFQLIVWKGSVLASAHFENCSADKAAANLGMKSLLILKKPSTDHAHALVRPARLTGSEALCQ